MQNWPIAILEHYGLLTREEAEHIANEIKNTIGSETYTETYEIVKNIIAKGNLEKHDLLPDLSRKIKALQARVDVLKPKNKKVLDVPKKAM